MKKLFVVLVLACATAGMWAQDAFTVESDHYAVVSYSSEAEALAVSLRLEAGLAIFNEYFHYDLTTLPNKMKVKIFAGKPAFDTYVQRLIGETRDDYVYLHYSNPARSELVGFTDPETTPSDSGISHQSFVQFIRSFVPNAPLWLREGFGIYFESIAWDQEAGTATLEENLSWLETYKGQVAGTTEGEVFGLEDLLAIGTDTAREKIKSFYPQAWALVHYLAESPDRFHNRILWDAITSMDPALDLVDNSSQVAAKAFRWVDLADLATAVDAYYATKKTFPELVQEGIDLYSSGRLADANEVFEKALAASTTSYVPYYYLGLVNYDNGMYVKAEEYYKEALGKGANAALTNYALGVSSFADNRYEEAQTFLDEAVNLDPSYLEKATEIKNRMASN